MYRYALHKVTYFIWKVVGYQLYVNMLHNITNDVATGMDNIYICVMRWHIANWTADYVIHVIRRSVKVMLI